MTNQVLLRSTYVDVRNNQIIQHVLVESFCCRCLALFFSVKFISSLHISAVILLQSLLKFYDRLLMWCLICAKNFSFTTASMTKLLKWKICFQLSFGFFSDKWSECRLVAILQLPEFKDDFRQQSNTNTVKRATHAQEIIYIFFL